MQQLKIKKLNPQATLPRYGSAGAAAFDVCALESGIIQPGSAATFTTGLAFDLPEGWHLLAFSRSGHGFRHGVRLSNSVGLIDSDYRGELKVRLQNDGWQPYRVQRGERIAQCMPVYAPQLELIEVDDTSDTERGDGGFGSTGR